MMKENNLTNEQLRMRAIELYKKNWNVSEICTTLNRSRKWFYKWLQRYNNNDPHWYKEQSRAPKTKKCKTSPEVEELILHTRKQLLSHPYLQYGPQAIYYALTQKGINPPPVWTIARILKRHDLTKINDVPLIYLKAKNILMNMRSANKWISSALAISPVKLVIISIATFAVIPIMHNYQY